MNPHVNSLGQPIGFPVPDWTPRQLPPKTPMEGRFARIEPLDPARHADDLFAANAIDRDGHNWTYMFDGPYATLTEYRDWAERAAAGSDPMFHAIIDSRTGRAVAVAALMRIDPKMGSIEIGSILYSPLAQRTPVATESMYLFARRVFDELGYRRYEWKCDSLNTPSRRAAVRLGFSYEGIFRQAVVYKGRNRDTAWYAMIDKEWPALRDAYETWLASHNFDGAGHQRESLGTLTARALGK